MANYTNLNNIVQEYKVSRKGGARELQELQNRLKEVPVSLARLGDELSKYSSDLSDTMTCAELYMPGGRLLFLDDFVSHDEADEITTNMRLPYPLITINTSPVSEDFFKLYRRRLGELIIPAHEHPNAKILSNPRDSAVGIVFKRGRKLDYIELIFRGDML